MLNDLVISSPKRNRRSQTGWEGFFPYYAGYPESFASDIIQSANLSPRSVILDPWNGSGTTIYAARKHGHLGLGLDLNPVMIVVARARMLLPSEADCLEPLSQKLLDHCEEASELETQDPLTNWFDVLTAKCIRNIEQSISKSLVGRFTLSARGADLDRLSSIASAFYVALFAVCRSLSTPFQSSNPTWLRKAKNPSELIALDKKLIEGRFLLQVKNMANALAERAEGSCFSCSFSEARLSDSQTFNTYSQEIDFVLTSPPYCTRIDYASATQIELAVLHGLMQANVLDLSRKMIGSTRVPTDDIQVSQGWGSTCEAFLSNIKSHPSKASSGYYWKTHLDYFKKMEGSLIKISKALKEGGGAVFVIQDSYYKNIHNDLPTIITEMAENHGFCLRRRENFPIRQSMAAIHQHSSSYGRKQGSVEVVLCFEKEYT